MGRARTTLILGAGASHAYGFPVGSGLRESIIDLADTQQIADDIGFPRARLRQLRADFHTSQIYSIDAFLGRRTDLIDVGRSAIAYVLLQCEQKADLMGMQKRDHWYQYLVNILAAEDWERFDPSWLSVVTFNYDRSLENYLLRALVSIYKKAEGEVVERLRALPILHVYGSLGDPWPSHQHVPFGGVDQYQMASAVRQASPFIQIIPEGREDAESLTKSRSLINQAERVGILGFGFDETNVARLGAPNVFLNPHGHPKNLAATSLGLSEAQVGRASTRVFNASNLVSFRPLNCIDLLHNTLILE